MSSSAAGSASFLADIKVRRSVYTISSASPIPDAKVVEIVQQAILHAPSSFNSQSSRAVVLFGEDHTWLWDTVLAVLKPIVPAAEFPQSEGKINGCFKAGHGTVLFFEDHASVKAMQDAFPLYAAAFPTFSLHTSGMVQFIVWTALAKEGLGATLQHYNPLIDEKVREHFNLPVTWQLASQMPFGVPTAPNAEKTFNPIEERVKVFGI